MVGNYHVENSYNDEIVILAIIEDKSKKNIYGYSKKNKKIDKVNIEKNFDEIYNFGLFSLINIEVNKKRDSLFSINQPEVLEIYSRGEMKRLFLLVARAFIGFEREASILKVTELKSLEEDIKLKEYYLNFSSSFEDFKLKIEDYRFINYYIEKEKQKKLNENNSVYVLVDENNIVIKVYYL